MCARISQARTLALHWNGYAQQSCTHGEWFQLSILQLSRYQKKFSWRKIDIGTGKLPCDTANDCELLKWRAFARRIKIPFLDFK